MLTTVFDYLARHAKEKGEHTYIIEADRHFSYKEIFDASTATAESLLAAGVRHQDRVGLSCKDKPLYVIAFFACHAIGAIAVPIDQTKKKPVQVLLNDAEAEIMIVDDAAMGNIATECGIQFINIHQTIKSEPAELSASPATQNDTALISYTSGTTSKRKGAVLTQEAFLAPALNIGPAMDTNGKTIEYVCGDIDHAFAIGRLRNLTVSGGTFVCDNGPLFPPKVLASIASNHCTGLSSPGAGFVILYRRFFEDFVSKCRNVKVFKMASQAVPVDIKLGLIKHFPDCRIFQNYGLTEAQRTTLIELNVETDHIESSGKALSPNEVFILDPETREALPENETGLIAVKGPHIMSGYWKRPDLNRTAIQNGMLITDDLGFKQPSGHLVFVSRRDDIINVGGEKISPLDIEDALESFLEGIEFVVAAIPDPAGLLGDVPALFIKSGDNHKGTWADWPKYKLAILKAQIIHPRHVPVHAFQLNELPKTQTGKVKRKGLAKLIEG